MEIEFSNQRTPQYYRKRLECLGFKGIDRVLDAACGMGQWSLALADLNDQVEGVDLHMGRLLIGRALAQEVGKGNCCFRFGSIDSLPYPPEYFDGIFCYGAFMFTDMPKTLAEFNRVLRPGGQLYLNANSYGWYAHLLIDRGIRGGNIGMAREAFRYLVRTLMARKRNVIVSKRGLRQWIRASGMRIIAMASEGEICLALPSDKPSSAYPDRFYGMQVIIEVLAQKGWPGGDEIPPIDP